MMGQTKARQFYFFCEECGDLVKQFGSCDCEDSMMHTAAKLIRGVNNPELVRSDDWLAVAHGWLKTYDVVWLEKHD